MGLQRIDDRSDAVIREAKAIGTAYLRTGILAKAEGAELRKLLRAYLELRIGAGSVDLTQEARWREQDTRVMALHAESAIATPLGRRGQ